MLHVSSEKGAHQYFVWVFLSLTLNWSSFCFSSHFTVSYTKSHWETRTFLRILHHYLRLQRNRALGIKRCQVWVNFGWISRHFCPGNWARTGFLGVFITSLCQPDQKCYGSNLSHDLSISHSFFSSHFFTSSLAYVLKGKVERKQSFILNSA